MAESRRLQLTTLCRDHGPSSSDQPQPPGALREGDTGSACGSVRLVLTLFEPDDRSFPEFSYSQLLDSQINHTTDEIPLSRFEEEEKRENDEIAAISKKLEEKYGSKPKKKDRIQDLIDIGFGYDEEDSFIDNSEAYDEFVPASITTKFGGFYVNSGVLHFRHTSETDATEEETAEPSKKGKVNAGQDKPKKKRCRESGEMMSNRGPKSSALCETGPDDEPMMKKKKKKKTAGTLSVTSMLKKFQREKEKERLLAEMTIPLCPADAGGGGGSGLTDPLLSLIGSTNDHTLIQAANTVDFDIDLDSLLDVTEATFSPKTVLQPAVETQLFRPRTDDQTQDQAGPQVQPPKTETKQTSSAPPPLPEGLPPRLEDSIQKLMAVAKTTEGESKLRFFTPEINSILLDIEVQCREQGVQLRSKVYTHLSSFLPCSRDTLLKRVKKLFTARIEEEPADLQDPMQKLKEAISRAMPEQITCFNENCQVYEQIKTAKASEEEKEGKQKVDVCPEDNMEEKVGKRGGGGPKKVFKWNDEIREIFCQVLKVKMESYKKENKGSQEMENHLKTMLENEIQPLWPKGWMQSRVLIRESRKMLSLFMSLPVKRARPEKKQPSISACPATVDQMLQGPPLLKGPPQETSDVITISSDVSDCMSLGPEKEEAAGEPADEGSSTPAEANTPPVNTKSAPTRSPLDLLADQALARAQPLSVSQKLLAAAVAKYKRSVQHWSFELDTKSPPLPPPPPQSSPVGVPLSQVCPDVLPGLLQVGDFTRHVDADHVQIISDDDDITMQ